MARNERIDGLFVTSDNAAMGALRLLHERGVQTPGDLVIVSVDNVAGSAYAVPSLTTIDIRIRERARIAVSELVHLLEDPHTEPRDVTVAVNLVVRESSRPRTLR
jgi:DNA-binding LacI/PurR family transcriptional regulator